MKKHRTLLLRLATNLSSREAGFCFALLGVLVQACHTWFLAFELSSLPGIWRTLQAGMMAIFISAALLYFTLKSSDEDTKQAKKYRKIVWWFACVETFINLYYWGDHLLIKQWPTPDYGSFIIAIPFSILLPFVLKSYGSEVRTEDYSELNDDLIDSLDKDLDNLLNEQKPDKDYVKGPVFPEHGNWGKESEEPIPLFEQPEEQAKVEEEQPKVEEPEQTEEQPKVEEPEQHKVEEPEQTEEQPKVEEPSLEEELEKHIYGEHVKDETPTEHPQIQKVFDAKGEQINEEPIVERPNFSSPKNQVVIQNGSFSTAPAYVHHK